MFYRVLIGAGLFVLGYYVGRESGGAGPIRQALEKRRQEKETSLEQVGSEDLSAESDTGKDKA